MITAQNLARPLKEANHEAGIERFLLSTDVEERDFKDAELRDHIEAAPAEVSSLWIIDVGPAAAP